MGDLSLDGIGHAYEGRKGAQAVDDVSFTVGDGEFWTLLGPSGSGKSTLLRIIGGYLFPDRGRLLLSDQDITRVPPRHRDMGMVFQDYALFPHMTVFDNIAYGLRARRLPQDEVRSRVEAMVALNRLTGLELRYPQQLSGGQQQRVALARALVIRPTVLLMDEAMGALDLKLREAMEVEVRRIQRELGTTTVHVTHDQAEAMTMSDRIVVLRNGKVEQIGTPQELSSRPVNRFVAEFVGSNNVIPIEIASCEAAAVRGRVVGEGVEMLLCCRPPAATARAPHFLVLRPEETVLSADPVATGFAGTIVAAKYFGTNRCLVVETSSGITVSAMDTADRFKIGDPAFVSWTAERAHLVPEAAAS